PLPLRQFPLELQLFPDKAAQIEGSGELLANHFQRRVRFSGDHSPMRPPQQLTLPVPAVANLEEFLGISLWPLQPLRRLAPGVEGEPDFRQLQLPGNPAFGKSSEFVEVS